MALARYERPIQDDEGKLITASGFFFHVRREDVAGTPNKPIYADRNGVMPLTQPAELVDGKVAFHAAGGAMRVHVYGPGYDEEFRYVPIGTGAEVDADQLLIPGYLFEFETGTTAPPGEGGIRANNAALGSVTRLFIWKSTIAGSDVSARIEALLDKRILLTSTNAGEQVSYDVDLVTDQTTYYELVVSGHEGAASFPAGRVGLQREGSEGPPGASGVLNGVEVVLTGASETLAASYNGNTVILNRATAMALSAQAAATLGATWLIVLKNIGAGTVTFDPNGAELVDGVTSIDIPQNCSMLISCNGTELRTEMKSFSPQPITEGGTGKTTAPAALEALAAQSLASFSNLRIAASVGANALTVSILGADGNALSANNPAVFAFRNPTINGGGPVIRSRTSSLTLTVSSGSTMGFTSGTPGRLWLVIFDDGGTLRLGVVNVLGTKSIRTLAQHLIESSTAEGGAGAADSAQVIYTGTAVSAKSMLVLGYFDWASGLATAGTWNSGPTLIQTWAPGVPLPGDVLQVVRNETGAVATGTTLIPYDDTIPQNTEGNQYLSQAITCRAAMNVVRAHALMSFAHSAGGRSTIALFQASNANAIAVSSTLLGSNDAVINELDYLDRIGSAAAQTFAVRVGNNNAGTTTFNGSSGTRLFGGAFNSFLELTEIMA